MWECIDVEATDGGCRHLEWQHANCRRFCIGTLSSSSSFSYCAHHTGLIRATERADVLLVLLIASFTLISSFLPPSRSHCCNPHHQKWRFRVAHQSHESISPPSQPIIRIVFRTDALLNFASFDIYVYISKWNTIGINGSKAENNYHIHMNKKGPIVSDIHRSEQNQTYVRFESVPLTNVETIDNRSNILQSIT